MQKLVKLSVSYIEVSGSIRATLNFFQLNQKLKLKPVLHLGPRAAGVKASDVVLKAFSMPIPQR
jgi:hypothetical protein